MHTRLTVSLSLSICIMNEYSVRDRLSLFEEIQIKGFYKK